MHTLGIHSNSNESRRVSSAYGRGKGYGRGRGGRGRGRGRGRDHGRGYGRENNRDYRHNNNDGNSNYIPKDIIDNLPPKYRAMMFKGRDAMKANDNANDERNVGRASSNGGDRNDRTDDNDSRQSSRQGSRRSASSEEKTNAEEDGNPSSQSGYNGNKRRRIGNDNNRNGQCSEGHTKSSARRVRATGVRTFGNSGDLSLRARADIDTKADTVCAGSTFELHEDIGKVVNVHGFHNDLGIMKDITVGTAITAIDLEDETIIGIFPQSLYFGESMKDSLIPPAQMWVYGMIVDVAPKQYSSGKSLHGIYHHDEGVTIPFSIHDCISYIPTRLPSNEEKRSCR